MPHASNDGLRVYTEVTGGRPPLVLMHGTSATGEFWRQFRQVEALWDEFQPILVDARGHGASDKPRELEAYRRTTLVADVVAVLDDLAIDKAHCLGYSMGGFIGYGIASDAPMRLHSRVSGDATLP
jgi:pimeloyl-ACP methyl ester carboxylesterase